MSSEVKAPQVEFDHTKAVEATGTKGVFVGTIIDAVAKLSDPKDGIDQSWQLEVHIQAESREGKPVEWKPVREWYAYANIDGSAIKGIGSKWMNLMERLASTNAMKDISKAGSTTQEMMANFAKSLIGMNFKFEEFVNYPKGVHINDYLQARAAGKPILPKDAKDVTKSIILPLEYNGRKSVGMQKTTVSDL